MSSIFDINSDSEDDQDYVPSNAAESDESEAEINEEENERSGSPTPKKIKLDEKEHTIDKEAANSIWRDFLKDVDSSSHNGGQKKAIASSFNLSHQNETDSSDLSASQGKTKDLEKSACEMTMLEKEKNSANMTKNESVSDDSSTKKKGSSSVETIPIDISTDKTDRSGIVKPDATDIKINTAKAGLSSILGIISNKNKKMTVLEKSMLDWKNFKKEENIEKDLETFNKGRLGFVERQRFLERSDLRLFESEKSARLSGRKK